MPLGYILVGGAGRRMRRDKALLPWYQGPLFAHLADELAPFCTTVSLVGRERVGFEGYQVLPDFLPGMGPLGGIASALHDPGEPWRLVVSCDLPLVNGKILAELREQASGSDAQTADLIVPVSEDGRLQPLCALWHWRVGRKLRFLLNEVQESPNGDHRRLSVLRFAESLHVLRVHPSQPDSLRNVNTMREYLAALGGRMLKDDRE